MTTETSNGLDGASLDVAADNRARLRALYPSCFAETRDEKGNLVESVDFERLKAELGTFTDLFEARRERYGMDWPGKKDALKLIQTPTYATLKPAKDQSVDWESTENVFIEGDNLEALKLLQKSYYGKVKMIYIDPPYNTGGEFIYPDNYSEGLDTYLAYAGLVDAEGKKFSTNTTNEGRFHTKWLNMLWPRLYLARNLLANDGAIFISIDDNEAANLRKLCDEIFGEENFLCTFAWEKRYAPPPDTKDVGYQHETIVMYRKGPDFKASLLPVTEEQVARYKNVDNDPRGPWKAADYTCRYTADERPTLYYPIVNPNTGEEVWPKRTRVWGMSREMTEKNLRENRIWWGTDGANSTPALKNFLNEIQQGRMPSTLLAHEEVGHTDEAAKELRELIPEIKFTPKPTRLIKHLVRIAAKDGGIVLDFFAGSATTAHAVMALNREEGQKWNYVMVQLPEPTDADSEIHRAGIKTIADIAKERIRRAAAMLTEADSNESGQDRGFRVLKLDKSNFRQWQKLGADASADQIAEQLELHVEHVDPSASQEDLLFEILLKAGFRPTEKAELVEIAGLPVYSIAGGALLICLADRVTKELVDAVAEAEPMHFFCLDSAFAGDDQLKANAAQTFAARNQGREKASQIVFRTV